MNSLLHLPKTEFPGVLRRIDGLLKPGGLVFVGVYGGYESEGIWEKDSYRPQRFFSFFTDEELVRQAEQARGFDSTGKSLIYKIRKYVMYMIPLFALSLRRSEEFTNALIGRGYAFTGEAARVKRADYILTHYTFKGYDKAFTVLLALSLVAVLVLRYGLGYFGLDDSWLIQWLSRVV
jgi:hypothetical protein